MPAYVHVNMRVIDPARQAALLPRFQATLQQAGGRVLHFGPVAKVLEGDEAPLPLAGVFEFPSLAAALAFYDSEAYARSRRSAGRPRRRACSSSMRAEWAEQSVFQRSGPQFA